MSAPSCTKSQPQQRGAGLDFGKDFCPTPPGRKARDMDSAPMPDGKPGQEVPKFKPAALPHWLTAPGRPRSAQPRSCRGHHRTCSSAGSASPPPLCRVGVPHHQTASPAEGSSPSGPPSWRWGESRDPGQPAQGHSDKQGGCWEPPEGEGRGTGPRERPPAKLLPIVSSRKPSQNTLLFSGGSPGALLPLSSVHVAVPTHPA